jgi:hypothetical protein
MSDNALSGAKQGLCAPEPCKYGLSGAKHPHFAPETIRDKVNARKMCIFVSL